jgi:hypothetical protein
MSIYPEDKEALYYIYIDDERNEVTLYHRHFFMTCEEFSKLKDHPFINNEGHPYQIFRLQVPPLGCIPNVSWYKWMVDRLNSSN